MAVHSPPTLLLTRPRAASERFAEGLQGFDVVISPLMEIVATGETVSLDDIAGVILTSENAVPFLPPAPLPAYCVGPRTAEAARGAGFDAEMVGPDADGLVTSLIERRPHGALLHVHGTHTRGGVVGRLRAAGVDARGIAAYDQRAVAPDARFHAALEQSNFVAPLFSPRSAALFAEAAPQLPENAVILAMSKAAKDALPTRFHPMVRVISQPNGEEMRKAVEPFGMRRNSP